MQNITETGLSTISNKIVETVLSNRVKKKSNPPPPVIKICEWGPWDLPAPGAQPF